MLDTTIDQNLIERIKLLLDHAESGNDKEVNELLDELTASRETSLYEQLGKLTRDLHETFEEFSGDSRLTELANTDIKDARERLHFVVTKTQEAADLTMTQIEHSIPLCESIMNGAQELNTECENQSLSRLNTAELDKLSKKVKGFLESANKDGETLKTHLNEVLLAQDFQDITGQVIFKVIRLVEDVEAGLVNLVKLASQHTSVDGNSDQTEQMKAEKEKKEKSSLDGPVVPGISNAKETVSGQDEVDDLLSSLGF